MSDLYLELRARIPVVAEQTHIGTARLAEAQKVSGLSNEAIARRVHISEKTWRRWKKVGEVPTPSLPAVASALGLELGPDDELRELRAALSEVRQELAEIQPLREQATRIEGMLHELLGRPPGGQAEVA